MKHIPVSIIPYCVVYCDCEAGLVVVRACHSEQDFVTRAEETRSVS